MLWSLTKSLITSIGPLKEKKNKYKKVHKTVFFTKINTMVKLGNSLTVKIAIS